MIAFTIPGDPKAQGRPRFARMGKFVKTYDPKDSADFKHKVALFAIQAGVKPSPGPIHMVVDAYFKRPKRLCRRLDDPKPQGMDKRPDADNILKALLDGLNGVAFLDDGQVCNVQIRKWYHAIGEAPRTEVQIC